MTKIYLLASTQTDQQLFILKQILTTDRTNDSKKKKKKPKKKRAKPT